MMQESYISYLFFVGLSIGAIVMAILYNLFLYLFHKEKLFLYYALMQSSIVTVLLYDTKIITYFFPSHDEPSVFYKIISHVALFFILMFVREFFDSNHKLPKIDNILKYILLFIIVNVPFYHYFLIFDYGLYMPIFLFILYVAYLRAKDGFYLANFFLTGWGVFISTIFLDAIVDFDFKIEPFSFNPMLLGAVIEALILGLIIAYKFKELREEKEREHHLLLQQSKLASLGELLGNIAHQWRQPLSRLSYMMMNIKVTPKERRDSLLETALSELNYLSETIDDFTNFYRASSKKEYFSIYKEFKKTLSLLDLKDIKIEIETKTDKTIYNDKSAFRQVILNLLQNSKDIFEKQNIKEPKISVTITQNSIILTDNGGGIKIDEIDKVFEPYFTTKEDGLGIGLYMSKMIVEKQMRGKLDIKNSIKGVEFRLIFR